MFSARDSEGHAVVVGTMYSAYEPKTLHVYVLPLLRIVKAHRVGVPGIKPTDRACADAGKHSSVLIGRDEEFVDAQTPPKTHHQQGITTANVNDICPQNLPPNLFLGRTFFNEEEDVSLTF
jgi:hypothetical protein